MRLATFGAVIVLTAISVAAQTKGGGADEAGIAKARTAYQTAAMKQDAAAVAKLYTADGVEMPPNAKAAKGRAAIEAYHKQFASEFMNHGMTITSTETKVMGDTAIDVGTYKQSLMFMKGGGMFEDVGKYLVVLKKDATGNWLISHAIYNSDVPPPAPPKK